jgi:hypothetical protein
MVVVSPFILLERTVVRELMTMPQILKKIEFGGIWIFSIKEGLLFLLIDHPAHPIDRGGSNQMELLASPDSPSPCALLGTLHFR